MDINYRAIAKVCSLVTIFIGMITLIPAIVSLIYGEIHTAISFAICAVAFAIVGFIIHYFARGHFKNIRARDAILTVSSVWLVTILLGAITLYITTDLSIIDALFESTSGFTTTGATIISDIESMPHGIMFYRSFSHWLGGLCIILLVILALPILGSGGQVIAQAESSKSMTKKVFPKHVDIAKRLFLYYTVMTIACTLLLCIGKMNFFDSLIHGMGTVSTGGFSNYNNSIIGNSSLYECWIIVLFMIFGSVNFTLYHYLFSSHYREVVKDTELKWYMFFLIGGSLLVSANVFFSNSIDSFVESITHGTFNLVSTISTTGFASYDFDLWPSFAKMLILLTMLISGCAASTSGGIKVYRIVVALKLIKRNITRRLHPNAHVSLKNDEGPMRADFVSAVTAYIFLYIIVIFASCILLSFDNKDFITTISAVMSCMANVGTGLNEVGPGASFDIFSTWGKMVLIFDMVVGRLELFGIILLFTPNMWNADRYRFKL